jgi:hypothetical protein
MGNITVRIRARHGAAARCGGLGYTYTVGKGGAYLRSSGFADYASMSLPLEHMAAVGVRSKIDKVPVILER